MAAVRAKNSENILSNESALVAGVVDDDLDRFLTPVAGEAKIESVGGRCHLSLLSAGLSY